MAYVPLEKLVKDDNTSVYKIVLTAALRANEIAEGVKPLVETTSKKVSTVALEEIAADKVKYEIVSEAK